MVQPRLTQSQCEALIGHCWRYQLAISLDLKSEHFDAQGMPTKEAASAT